MRRWLVYGGVVALIVLALLWARRDREAHGRRVPADEEAEDEDPVQTAPAHLASADGGPLVDRKRRDAILEVLRGMYGDAAKEVTSARNAPAGGGQGAAPGTGAMPDDGADLRRYIRDRVRSDFMPLGGSCYEAALAKDKTLGGRVTIKFRIVGDKSVGGVVDEAEIDRDASTIDDRGLLECLAQSMQSVVFDAPAKGGYVTVDYPFEFSPDDPPEGGSGAK
jgi:hypothetical protein